MTDPTRRPIERRVLRLVGEGRDHDDIARRFKRSPEMIARVIEMSDLRPPAAEVATGTGTVLRPIERRVLRWRESGADHDEIGTRFRRSAGHIRRVEGFARGKLAAADEPDG
jgi:DNA-binding CsgD family transcriptional regulator